ncbi:hypothetical protein [Bacillus sp. MUM 13]|uniref:hypothetical protein n=1 Tax=Bacillus sp. MUM 13 TaxID=1678001 RepID=UPI00147DF2EE|nr:hypothetical protein [Bacillus sp. MUM 13]
MGKWQFARMVRDLALMEADLALMKLDFALIKVNLNRLSNKMVIILQYSGK